MILSFIAYGDGEVLIVDEVGLLPVFSFFLLLF